MATHDYNIANADGATVRADINSVLEAVATNNSSSTAPSVTFPYMFWFDTSVTPGKLKQRNGANTAWIDFIDDSEVTTSTGTQALAGALDDGDRLNKTVTPEQFGAIGDGIADDTSAIESALTDGRPVIGKPGAVYRITSARSYAIFVDFTANGSSFEFDFSVASPAYALTLSGGSSIDRLEISVPTAVVIDRPVLLSGSEDHVIGDMVITSVDQQNNRSASEDAAIGITADNAVIRRASTANFDNGIYWNGDGGFLGKADITSYVRGVWLTGIDEFEFKTIRCSTASANASLSPGHNGLLVTNITNSFGGTVDVRDAAEHGIRFGGQTTGSDNVYIHRITAKNVGACGFKMRTGADGTNNTNIQIDVVDVEDCGDATDPIDNQIGLLLERVRNLHIGKVIVRKKNKTFSALHGVEFTDSKDVSIDSYFIEDTKQEGFFFNDEAEASLYRDINNINIGSGRIAFPGRHGIRLLMTNSVVFRRINFLGRACMTDVGGAALHSSNATGGSMGQVSEFNIYYELAGSSTNNPLDGGYFDTLFNLNVCGNGFVSVNATNGSLWQQPDNGTTYVKTAGPTWTAI